MDERDRHTVILRTATVAKVENLAILIYSSKRKKLISITEKQTRNA